MLERVLAVLLLAGASAGWAADADLDSHVLRLASELRCVVCQNQTLADSHAELAADLRRQIGEQLRAGASDAQVKDYMVQRYGDFVLYDPPLQPRTWLLWFGPAILLAVVVAMLVRSRRKQS